MQVAILCLAIVAYGDGSDYIPPSSAKTAGSRASDFSSAHSAGDFATTAQRRQRQLDNELRNKTRTLPAPLNTGTVRAASGTLGAAAGSNVIRAQHQIDDSWPNRPIDGAGYGQNRAATDPTDMDSRQRFSLNSPRTTTDSGRQTLGAVSSGPTQNGNRSRYIPAGTKAATTSTRDRNPIDDRSTQLGAAAASQYGNTDRNRRPLTPRYIAADTTDQADAGGDFGATSRRDETATPRGAGDSSFDLSEFNRQYEAGQSQENGPPPMTRTPATTFPPTTSQQPIATRSPQGGNYLPPSSAGFPESSTVPANPRRPSPRVVSQADPWPAAQPRQPDLVQRSPAVITPNSNATTNGFDPNRQVFRNDGIERAAADVARAAEVARYNTVAAVEGGSFMTLLMLFGSIGLNLYLGWIAWDTYNRYQDMVADIRYTSPRREALRDEYVERVA